MNFNKHSELEGKHALFGASKHSWLNYDDEQLYRSYISSFAQPIGTLVHEYAKDKILFRQPMEDNRSERNAMVLHLLKNGIPYQVIPIENLFYNLMPYVNDAIGFKMTPEQVLYYSEYSFGTADAISYGRNVLRIHDLKTGVSPASMDQLMVYAAWFFLEYKKEVNFQKSRTELRIYQNQEVVVHTPTNKEISEVMEKVIHGAMVIEKKLMDKIESHPEIARQLVLLPNASISTMHAFCQRLIRENFAVADVDPKFRLVNEQERELMRQSVVRELFERMYEKQDEAFLRFARHYGSDRNDENLYAMVLKLYDFAESQAEPEDWLNHWGENARRLQYDSMEEAEWYPLLIRSIRRELRACHDAAAYFSEQADRDGISTYAEIFEDDEVLIDGLAQAVETEQWEVMQQAFCSIPKFRDLRKPPKMEIAKETASFYSEGRKNQIKAPLSVYRIFFIFTLIK